MGAIINDDTSNVGDTTTTVVVPPNDLSTTAVDAPTTGNDPTTTTGVLVVDVLLRRLALPRGILRVNPVNPYLLLRALPAEELLLWGLASIDANVAAIG